MGGASDITLARTFGTWAASLKSVDIPADVVTAARRAILDTVGVMAAGAVHSATGRVAAAFGHEPGGCRRVDGIVSSPASAALINGTAAHAYDFDDVSYTGIMHGSAVILPAVIAAAEETGADDAEVVAAFVAGSEVAYVLGDVLTHTHYFRGWWSTVTLGTIGAAAAVAKIYRLDADGVTDAVGLAAANAGGAMAVFGTDGKPFLVGLAARTAIDIAKAARAGVAGPARGFEDARGFFALLNGGASALAEAATLGRRWRLVDPGLLVKRYPVCSAAQALIEQTALLCRAIDADSIESIECHVPTLVDVSLMHDEPLTVQEAQFSLPYAVACAARGGALGLDDLTTESLADPAMRALMRRVRKIVDAGLSSHAMRMAAPESARVVVRLKDGRTREGFCPVASGMPSRPLSDAELAAKFDACVAFAQGRATETAAPRRRLLSLGEPGGKHLSESLAEIWSSARKDDPIPVSDRLARGLRDECRRSAARAE